MPDKIKDVYDIIKDQGYFKDENEFRSYISDPKKRKEVYEVLQPEGYFADEKEFNSYFTDVAKPTPPQPPTGPQPETPQPRNKVAEMLNQPKAVDRLKQVVPTSEVTSGTKVPQKGISTEVAKQEVEQEVKAKENLSQRVAFMDVEKLADDKKISTSQLFDETAPELLKYLPEDKVLEYDLITKEKKLTADKAMLIERMKATNNPNTLGELNKTKVEEFKTKFQRQKLQEARREGFNKEIAKLDALAKQMDQEGKTEVAERLRQDILATEGERDGYFKNPNEQIQKIYSDNKSDMDEFQVPGNTPLERTKNYALILQKQIADLNEKMEGDGAQKDGSMLEGISKVFDDQYQFYSGKKAKLDAKLAQVAPIALLNQLPQRGDDGFFNKMTNSIFKELLPDPVMSRPENLTFEEIGSAIKANQISMSLSDDLITEGAIGAVNQMSEKPEAFSAPWWGELTGNSLALMPAFLIGNKASAAAKVPALFEKVAVALKAQKYGKYLSPIILPAEKGLEYAAAKPFLSENLADEASFLSGYLGQAISGPVGSVLSSAPITNLFNKMFGSSAPIVYNQIKALGNRVSSGLGEYGEEVGNTLGPILETYIAGQDFGQLKKDLSENFGELDANLELFVGSVVMGMAMGGGSGIGKASMENSKKIYNQLPPAQQKKADAIANALKNDIEKAEVQAKKEEIQEGAEPLAEDILTEEDKQKKTEAIEKLNNPASTVAEKVEAGRVLNDIQIKEHNANITEKALEEVAGEEVVSEEAVKLEEPSSEQQLKDIQEGNVVTFEYKNESEVPEVFKDKISSKGETNGKPYVKVTIAKSLADFRLQEQAPIVETPIEQPQAKEEIVETPPSEVVSEEVVTPREEVGGFDFEQLFEEQKAETPEQKQKVIDDIREEEYQKSSFDKKWAGTYQEAKTKLVEQYNKAKQEKETWESKSYKSAGDKSVFVGGELEGNDVSVNSINERRKRNNIKNAQSDMDSAKKDLASLGLSESEINDLLPTATQPQAKEEIVKNKKADIEIRRQELESSRELEMLYDLRKPIAEDSKEIISKINEANRLREQAKNKSDQARKETDEDTRIALNTEAQSLNEKAQVVDKEIKASRDNVIESTPIKQAISSAKNLGQRVLTKIKLASKSNEWISSMPISKEDFIKLEDATKRLSVKNMGEVTSNSEVIPDILLVEEINAKYDAEIKALETPSSEVVSEEVITPREEVGEVEVKNEGKADTPTKENVTERLNINNPFYKKVEDALVKLGLIEKYNPETKTGDVIGGYAQQIKEGEGFAAGDMYFYQDGSISYIKGGVVISFDKNGNVISENTKQVAQDAKKSEIEGTKDSITKLEKTRDSEAFKYKEVTETDILGNRKKVKRLKTQQELKESTDKINDAIRKAKERLAGLEQQAESPNEQTTPSKEQAKEVVSEEVKQETPKKEVVKEQPKKAPAKKKPQAKKSKPFVSKSGNQVVVLVNGELQVVDSKTKQEVSAKTRKKVLDEYVETVDFSEGKRAEEPSTEMLEKYPEDVIEGYVVDKSSNPLEVVEVFLRQEKVKSKPTTALDPGDKADLIADFGFPRIKRQGFERFGDRNLITMGMAKAYFGTAADKGLPIDSVAKSMSDYLDVEITPGDLVQFMVAYPNGITQALKLKDNKVASAARDKFKELTGLELTDNLAEKVYTQGTEQQNKKLEELTNKEYESRQKLEEEYWEWFAKTNDGTKDGDSAKVGTDVTGTEGKGIEEKGIEVEQPKTSDARKARIGEQLKVAEENAKSLKAKLDKAQASLNKDKEAMQQNMFQANQISLLNDVDAKAKKVSDIKRDYDAAKEEVKSLKEQFDSLLEGQTEMDMDGNPALANVEATAKALEGVGESKSKKFNPDDKVILTTKDGKEVEVSFRGYNSETKAVVFGSKGSGIDQMEVDVSQLRAKRKSDKLSKKEKDELLSKIDFQDKNAPSYNENFTDKELQDLSVKYPKESKLTNKEKQERNDLQIAITPLKQWQEQEYGVDDPNDPVNIKLAKEHKDAIDNIITNDKYSNLISEAYHKAKADGSNPELVKAVEDLLSEQPTKEKAGDVEKEYISVFHGGSVSDLSKANDNLFVSEDRKQAEAYAKGNEGKVQEYKIAKEDIIDEDAVRGIIVDLGLQSKEEGWDLSNELMLHEILDPTFDTSLSDADLSTLYKELNKRGFKAIEMDATDITGSKRNVKDILVLNPKTTLKTNVPTKKSKPSKKEIQELSSIGVTNFNLPNLVEEVKQMSKTEFVAAKGSEFESKEQAESYWEDTRNGIFNKEVSDLKNTIDIEVRKSRNDLGSFKVGSGKMWTAMGKLMGLYVKKGVTSFGDFIQATGYKATSAMKSLWDSIRGRKSTIKLSTKNANIRNINARLFYTEALDGIPSTDDTQVILDALKDTIDVYKTMSIHAAKNDVQDINNATDALTDLYVELSSDLETVKKRIAEELELGQKVFEADKELSRVEKAITTVADDFIWQEKMQKEIAKTKGTLSDDMNPYIQRDISIGRVADTINRVYQKIFGKTYGEMATNKKGTEGMVQRMAKDKLNITDLDFFMMVQHAKEYNKRVATKRQMEKDAEIKIYEDKLADLATQDQSNPSVKAQTTKATKALAAAQAIEVPDAGSGMTDAEADNFMKEFEKAGKKDKLEAYAKEFRETVITKAINLREEAGEYTPEQAQALREGKDAETGVDFEFYVPLKVKQEALKERVGDGGTRGAALEPLQRIKGTNKYDYTKRISPVTQSLLDFQAAVKLAEDNKVAQSLYNLVKENPNSAVWEIVSPTYAPDSNGVMKENTPKEIIDNSKKVKIGGKIKYIKFNHQGLRDAWLKAGGKQNTLVKLFYRLSNLYNTYKRAMVTQLSIEFAVTNAPKDLQDVIFNASGLEVKGFTRAVIKNYRKGMQGSFKAIMGNLDPNSKMGKTIDEFLSGGGKISWMNYGEIENEQKRIQGLVAKYGDKGAVYYSKAAMKNTLATLSAINESVEMGTRVAVFMAAREYGISVDQSAALAKNLSVNFNKKGTSTTTLQALWLFSNVGFQSLYTGLKALGTDRGKKRAAMVFGLGIAFAFAQKTLVELLSADDEEEDFYTDLITAPENANHFILPLGDKRYFRMPKSFGMMRVMFNGGYELGSMYIDGDTEEHAANMASTIWSTIDPITGNSSNTYSALFPTALRPFAEVNILNRDYKQSPILPDLYGAKQPDYLTYYERTNDLYKNVAKKMYWKSGETIDVSPETLEYIVSDATGGIISTGFKFYELSDALFKGAEVDKNKIPFYSKFMVDMKQQEYRYSKDFYEIYEDRGTKVINQIKLDNAYKYAKQGNAVRSSRNEPPLVKDLEKKIREIKKAQAEVKLQKEQREDYKKPKERK